MPYDAQATDTILGIIEDLDGLIGLGLGIPKTDGSIEGSYQRKECMLADCFWMDEWIGRKG